MLGSKTHDVDDCVTYDEGMMCCQRCGTELREHTWKKSIRVKGKNGIYRSRAKVMCNWRCGNCNWVKPTVIGTVITKPLDSISEDLAREGGGKSEQHEGK